MKPTPKATNNNNNNNGLTDEEQIERLKNKQDENKLRHLIKTSINEAINNKNNTPKTLEGEKRLQKMEEDIGDSQTSIVEIQQETLKLSRRILKLNKTTKRVEQELTELKNKITIIKQNSHNIETEAAQARKNLKELATKTAHDLKEYADNTAHELEKGNLHERTMRIENQMTILTGLIKKVDNDHERILLMEERHKTLYDTFYGTETKRDTTTERNKDLMLRLVVVAITGASILITILFKVLRW